MYNYAMNYSNVIGILYVITNNVFKYILYLYTESFEFISSDVRLTITIIKIIKMPKKERQIEIKVWYT